MIAVNPSTPIYLYSRSTDMRKSFSGLCGIVINEMKMNPEDGSLFVFVNKQRSRMKLLLWDRHGFWLFYKLLESGCFQLPGSPIQADSVTLAYEQLIMIIEGIDFTCIKRKKRYNKVLT